MGFKRNLAILLLLANCGDKNSGTPTDANPAPELSHRQKLTIESFNESQVKCANDDCPEAIASLFIMNRQKEDLFLCSGSLYINQNMVLTNRHCIPEGINPGDSCFGLIKAMFPKVADKEVETLDCFKVLSASAPNQKENYKQSDWAIIQLTNNSSRTPLKSNLSEPLPKSIDIYKSNREEIRKIRGYNTPLAVITKSTCDISAPNKSEIEDSPLLNISDCDQELIPGNSGAAYLHPTTGEIVGVHSWGRHFENFGGGTNIDCVSLPGDDTPKNCEL